MSKQIWSSYRTIVLDGRVEAFVKSKEQEDIRFEDQWMGAEWILARSAEKGVPRSPTEPGKYLLEGISVNEYADTKELWILYSYDEDHVYVHAAKIKES